VSNKFVCPKKNFGFYFVQVEKSISPKKKYDVI